MAELIPIGTLLSLLTSQVLDTAKAAKDVLIDKESFNVLSKYLYDIEPVLKELQLRNLSDSQAARQALEFLDEDVKKAKNLVEKYTNRSRFYILLRCRHIVKEVQEATRDIGRSFATLSLASTGVLSDIAEKVSQLHDEMQRAEFTASQSQLRIVEKLDQGLLEQKTDQGFANDILYDIARAVGVPVEPSEISRELANFKREKEEAESRKERAEVLFLEQVIKLLSQADAANDQEEVEALYYWRVETIEKFRTQYEYIPPFKSFLCPIDGTVMNDPVSLCSGTTCERASIQAWLDSGHQQDPDTGLLLDDLTLRQNVRLRQAIEEWRELNYCLKIRSAKSKLLSGNDLAIEDAFCQMQELVNLNLINKDWIAIEGLIDITVSILGNSHNKDVKKKALVTLMDLVNEHGKNKDRVVESGGVEQVVLCLGRDPNMSQTAVELLFELLQDGSTWNLPVFRKLTQQSSAILFLVMLRNGSVLESAQKAEAILLKLCDDDENNIVCVADANWYRPLINRLCQGPDSSRITMVRALVKMELVDQNIKLLGADGAIPPLVEMLSGSLELKELALCTLAKLSNCQENKRLIAMAGGVPLILEHLFASHVPKIITARCSEILEKLCSDDGVQFLVDAHGAPLDLEPIICHLLAVQQNPTSYHGIRKPSLRALLGIYKSEACVEKEISDDNGISVILPLLEDPDQEIQELAVDLLFYFPKNDPQKIVDFLLVKRRLEAFVGFLGDNNKADVQMAAAGILANLPNSQVSLMKNLIELDGLPAILNILKFGTPEAKEYALGALLRFTDPEALEIQRSVVELGAYPLFVSLIKSGTETAKARTVALIANLSLSTPRLSVAPKPTGCWHFRPARVPVCEVHRGVCDVRATFCLLKANALPELVKLLQGNVDETARESLRALATLFHEEMPYRAARVLDEANAIYPILEVLNWGTSALKEEALDILEKVFQARDVADAYCSTARIPLVGLTARGHEDGELARKASRILAQLERYSRSLPLV